MTSKAPASSIQSTNARSGDNRTQLGRITIPPSADAGPSGSSSQARKVRTVPPSAIYDPPSPPDTLSATQRPPLSTENPESAQAQTKRRPRLRVRYSTSESSADEETSDEDDDPPWWTFTQRGMQKMRQRNLRRHGIEVAGEAGTPAESGAESKDAVKKKFGSRNTSRENSGLGSVKTDASDRRRSSSPSKTTPRQKSFLNPSPIRLPSHLTFRRSSRENSTHNIIPARRPLARRNSAPESPVLADVPLPSIGSMVVPANTPDPAAQLTEAEGPISPRAFAKRQMTAPAFPFRKRLGESGENLTDSEAHMASSPRTRAKAKQIGMHLSNDMPHSDSPEDISRPSNRRKHSRLKLPPPIQSHFQNGWPHAGTWQDALYGTFDEEAYKAHLQDKRRASGHSDSDSKKPSLPTRQSRLRTSSRPDSTPGTPKTPHPESEEGPSRKAPSKLKRNKSRRRRYRHAIAPPTPRGLGFDHTEDEAPPKSPAVDGFDWNRRAGEKEARGAVIEEGDELSRSDTRAAASSYDKSSPPPKVERKWMFFRRNRPKRKIAVEDVGWKARWKRILFLDARVTIWLRLFNLAVVVALLGLSITIRLEMFKLRLPGIIGSSTTLIIAYAALTVVHALTAIYREYFGRPIGLWGLRSKMLWVCLDLLFVALWSSAMSLAVNDFIATPLQCTPEGPWWRSGLADNYIELLQELHVASRISNGDDLGSFLGMEQVGQTMGLMLPEEVLESGLAHDVCRRQAACIALSLIALFVYGGNMVLSLFRIFEVIKRAADVGRAVMV